jgi:hypothetical protein
MSTSVPPHYEETADDVIARGREAGVEISRDQLERWHRAGAVPSPRQKPLGPGGGSVTLYPPGTAYQAIALGRGLIRTRRLDEVAFSLWVSGSPIALPLVRRYLERVARWHDRLTSQAREAGFGTMELSDPALDLVEGVARKHAPKGPIAGVWDRLGSRGDRETLVRIFLDAAAGRYVPTPSPGTSIYLRESEGLLVERAVGLANGRAESLLNVGPWLTGDPEDALAGIPTLMSGEWVADLRSLSDDDLTRARIDLREFREVIATLGTAFGTFFGSDAFGLTAIGTMLGEPTTFDDAFLLLALARVRKTPELAVKLEVLLAALPEVRNLHALTEQVTELRSRPDVGDLFAPETLRAAFADQASLEMHARAVEQRVATVAEPERPEASD